MHKESFIINRNTHLHVSTLLGHLQGELFVTFSLGLHFTAVDCVLCVHSQQHTLRTQSTALTVYSTALTVYSTALTVYSAYTVNSTFSLNCKVQPQCNGNENFSLKMTQRGRNT
jgi:hypothetical protein